MKVEQLIVDGEKQLEAIIETHRQKMSPLYARRFDLNQIRKIAQQTQDDLRSSCEDREILARFESVNEELTELTNEQGKIQADIKQMKTWMDGDRHETKITAFASEAIRFTERADDASRDRRTLIFDNLVDSCIEPSGVANPAALYARHLLQPL